MKNQKKKGFTLIELVAVIAILAILGAMLLPNILGFSNKAKISKVKSDAKLMLNVVKTAQAEAEDASTITSYKLAVSAQPNLKLSKDPNAAFEVLTVSELQKLIDNTSAKFDPDYKAYYQK